MTLQDFLQEELADPVVRAAYDALEEEYALARALIQARQLSVDKGYVKGSELWPAGSPSSC